MGQHKYRKRVVFRGMRQGTGTADLTRHLKHPHVFVTLLELPTLQGNGRPFVGFPIPDVT